MVTAPFAFDAAFDMTKAKKATMIPMMMIAATRASVSERGS